MMDTDQRAALLDVHLAEYKELKAEQRERIKARDNLIYVTLTVAAAIGFAAVNRIPLQYPILLLVPLASFVLGWIYLMNDLKVSELGRYFREDLADELRRCAGTEGMLLGWEREHPRCTGRRRRKVIQAVVDLLAFCGSGAAAIITYWVTTPAVPVLFAVIAGVEAAGIAVLAVEIVAHAEFNIDNYEE